MKRPSKYDSKGTVRHMNVKQLYVIKKLGTETEYWCKEPATVVNIETGEDEDPVTFDKKSGPFQILTFCTHDEAVQAAVRMNLFDYEIEQCLIEVSPVAATEAELARAAAWPIGGMLS